ncbi:MAG: leucine-rich repeat-containing protein kinase family protein [Pseudomonadota bacterium]
MQTLHQLNSGALQGASKLTIADNLDEFPRAIFELAPSLEYLDLSGNQLDRLPHDFGRLHRLKILFLSRNRFTELPAVLADCPQLEMIGFKSNQIEHIPENGLPPALRWLILTDNRIQALPESLGRLRFLQKLMLAGNRLSALPQSLQQCTRLQLIRLSANQLPHLPDFLLSLPQLAWLAFAGNPFCSSTSAVSDASPHVRMEDLDLLETLGEGASGVIYRARWRQAPATIKNPEESVAVKRFKGEVTSDGYARDEMLASLSAGKHPNLVEVLAAVAEEDEITGLVMRLIPDGFGNLGLPPSFSSCTRDTFAAGTCFPLQHILDMAHGVADAVSHLHARGLCHGDLYAHNVLCNAERHVLCGDFGAAARFDGLPAHQQAAVQRIELRAFGHFLDDLSGLCTDAQQEPVRWGALRHLHESCVAERAESQLSMEDVKQALNALANMALNEWQSGAL